MYDFVICTTAITRESDDIHRHCFTSINNMFNDFDQKKCIKWFINIDNKQDDKENKQTPESLKELIQTILKDPKYVLNFTFSEKPNFFEAAKTLINTAKSKIRADTVFLWIEDDWELVREINLKKILDNYFTPNCYISLVFNKFCFPPFIAGLTYFRVMNKYFNKTDSNTDITEELNPEHYIRRCAIKYFQSNNYQMNNYLIIEDESNLDKLLSQSNNCFLASFFINTIHNNPNNKYYCIYEKDENKLLVEKINKHNKKIPYSIKEFKIELNKIDIDKNNTIKIINKWEKYETPEENVFNFYCFNGWHTMSNRKKKYNNTYFRDIGRLPQ